MKHPVIFLFAMSLAASFLHAQGTAQVPAPNMKPALNPQRFEKEIVAFEEADRLTPPPKGAALFIGASRVRLWKTLAEDLPELRVVNRAFGGSDAVDLIYFAPRMIFPYEPREIYISTGNNDLARGTSVEKLFEDIKELFALLREKLPDTDIVFISLSPSISRWKQAESEKAINKLVADFIAGKPRFRYIETFDVPLGSDGRPRPELFAADRLHLSPEGYKLFATRVRACLPR